MSGAPMGRWFRGNHVVCWATIGVAAAAVAVTSVLPGIRLAIGAYIGAGSTQRAFRYERDVSFAGELRPWGLLPLAVGLLLLAAAVLGILRGSGPWIAIGAFVVAIGLGWLVLDTSEKLGWDAHGVYGHEGPRDVLQPALHDLQAEARRSREARDPGWTLLGDEHSYAARGLVGWALLWPTTLVLLWLTAYRVARLRLRPWISIWLVAGTSVAVLAWLVFRGLSRYD